MGVAVFQFGLAVGFEAANAGMAVGPKAMVIASSRAIVLLGASEVLSLSNMFLLRPGNKIHSSGRGARGEILEPGRRRI
jgi:hypothetical protein